MNLGDDAMDVRLGGIYALQRIMEDSPRDQPTVANVLTAYVRTHAMKAPAKKATRPSVPPAQSASPLPADVFAALTVLSFRDPSLDGAFTPDLRGTQLSRAELAPVVSGSDAAPRYAQLTGANLTGADLADANLTAAKLGGASLYGADLTGAILTRANLSDANLDGANLRSADLEKAKLVETTLVGAQMTNANLTGADLRDANLTYAHMPGSLARNVNLAGAALGEADLRSSVMVNCTLTHASLWATDLRGANLTYVTMTGADLQEADLRGAKVTVQQIISANPTAKTKLSPGLAKSPAVIARIAEVEKQRAQRRLADAESKALSER
ncbi:pentapeptide repeat-containing protein [Streptomyces lunaelactis]|uniref:pentapeptide repeat-containing protein n=1 Tax=Streptomyces lunaelactis TaxID=1535768 RepID=UPI00131F0281|nr:pentapeptide repeat-containing protein [Streptomyces lunaelactis]NUK89724.1 pentapeptide repeat-containing protein [Streptomyces lunaelactis]